MKKIILFTILFLSIFYLIIAEEYDFRKTKWGMGKEEVMNSESTTLIVDENDMLVYQSQVADMECLIGYFFTSNKLTRTRYLFIHEHSNETDYIYDYERLKNMLNKKYDDPIMDEQYWKGDLYKDTPSEWGMAIITGNLVYESKWITDLTEILMQLAGDNFKIFFVIEYMSKQLEKLEEEAKEKEALEAF